MAGGALGIDGRADAFCTGAGLKDWERTPAFCSIGREKGRERGAATHFRTIRPSTLASIVPSLRR